MILSDGVGDGTIPPPLLIYILGQEDEKSFFLYGFVDFSHFE